MEQLIIMNEPSTNQGNLKELFDQFKFHLIYKNKPKPTEGTACQQLKNILSQIKRQCNQKRKKKKNTIEILQHLQVMQGKKRNSSTLQSRIWKPKRIDTNSLEAARQQLLIVEQEKQSLMAEIGELQNSVSALKKNVANAKKQVELQSAKEEKYKHISYLSKSIQRTTESNKTLNYRSYKKLIKYQEDAIGNLKKFKTTLRKDNQDSQSRYLQYKQMQNKQSKKSKMDIRSTASIKMQSTHDFKIDKPFFSKLEDLIKLFIQKQANFQQMKAQQTTKIRLKKIQKNYLKQQRVKIHDMIDRFEESHDVKIQSFPNLILYIYKRLNQDNQQMENQCVKHYKIKQILLQDLEKLKEKQLEIQTEQSKSNQSSFTYQVEKKKKIARNSKMFIQLVTLLHTLLGKFKYLFTMALTLNIEKKNFQDILSQMTKTYKSDSIFYQKDMQENSIFANYENITNFKEMEQMFNQYESHSEDKNDLLSLIFNDLRYSLMFRRSWLQQQIRQDLQYDLLLQKICSIQQRCEQAFDSKLKIYIHLLINSLKALTMNKYQKKIIASSNVKDSLFLSIPKPIHVYNLQENQEIQLTHHSKNSQEDRKFNSESSEQDAPNFKFYQNPRKIINLLQDLKNKEKRTFKPLQFQSTQVYLYDNKVILPKYVM